MGENPTLDEKRRKRLKLWNRKEKGGKCVKGRKGRQWWGEEKGFLGG